MHEVSFGQGDVRALNGTAVSGGARPTIEERSLPKRELRIPCFEQFLGKEQLGTHLYFVHPQFPSSKIKTTTQANLGQRNQGHDFAWSAMIWDDPWGTEEQG